MSKDKMILRTVIVDGGVPHINANDMVEFLHIVADNYDEPKIKEALHEAARNLLRTVSK